MGGKNPIIVLDDADIDLAVNGAVQGAYGSTGQRCTATSRAVVVDSIADTFVKRVEERVNALVVGNGIEPETDVGPSVDKQQLETVLDFINIGQQEGAQLITGGNLLATEKHKHGFFIEPSLFDHVTSDMQIAQEEIFGPVLSVLVYQIQQLLYPLPTTYDMDLLLRSTHEIFPRH